MRLAFPLLSLYFWLDPKVTKDQEPIKGDFCFAKPRSLLPLHAEDRSKRSEMPPKAVPSISFSIFLLYGNPYSVPTARKTIWFICFYRYTVPNGTIILGPLAAPHITGDGFDSLS